MSTSDCNVGASKSKDDGVCELNNKLQCMSTADVSICANCGKEDASNICNKCQVTKYCNAVCKKVHKKKHKKECQEHVRLAAEKHNEELKIAAELHDIELFKQPLPKDCPICFLPLPLLLTGYKYQTCCGKRICSGCLHAPRYDNLGNEVDNQKCPFCRTPAPPYSDEEIVKRNKKRAKVDDPIAIHNLGMYYSGGLNGYPQDIDKALELWHRAGELGHAHAYYNIGIAYLNGNDGVEVDIKKAAYNWELAAMRGSVTARHNLGVREARAGNMDRSLKHLMIAVGAGDNDSLERIKWLYTNGRTTKEDYAKALQLFQTYLSEIKSPLRDKAAAFSEELYRYY